MPLPIFDEPWRKAGVGLLPYEVSLPAPQAPTPLPPMPPPSGGGPTAPPAAPPVMGGGGTNDPGNGGDVTSGGGHWTDDGMTFVPGFAGEEPEGGLTPEEGGGSEWSYDSLDDFAKANGINLDFGGGTMAGLGKRMAGGLAGGAMFGPLGALGGAAMAGGSLFPQFKSTPVTTSSASGSGSSSMDMPDYQEGDEPGQDLGGGRTATQPDLAGDAARYAPGAVQTEQLGPPPAQPDDSARQYLAGLFAQEAMSIPAQRKAETDALIQGALGQAQMDLAAAEGGGGGEMPAPEQQQEPQWNYNMETGEWEPI